MKSLYIFNKEDNTSKIEHDLIVITMNDLSSGCFYVEVSDVEIRLEKMYILVSNEELSFTIIINKTSKDYRKFKEQFEFDEMNNPILKHVKAKLNIELEVTVTSISIEWHMSETYAFALKKLELNIFKSVFDLNNILFEFMIEYYDFFIALSLLYFKVDSCILETIKNKIDDNFLYEHNKNLDENEKNNFDPYYFSEYSINIKEWHDKLKNQEFNLERWIDKRISAETNKQKEDIPDDDYPEIEESDNSLENAGYTYDEDSEVYSLYDGPDINTIIERENAKEEREAYLQQQQEEYENEREERLINEFYFKNEFFNADIWKTFSSIINNEVIYHLCINKSKSENLKNTDKFENFEHIDLDLF